MRLPAPSSSYRQRVRFGRYVASRLRRAKLAQLAADVAAITAKLKEEGRAEEDTEDATQDALADRDGIDDDLDYAAQEARANLAGRSADAVKRDPYIHIFPNGLAYYTAAPLDEEEKRYGELKHRLVEHLPADDDVRKKTVKAIDVGLKDFAKATAQVDSARTAESLAATRLTKATDAWTRQMEKTYGALVAELGRARAEKFFPRTRTKGSDAAATPDAGSSDTGKPD